MSHSVVRVCVLGTWVSCAQMAEVIEMPLWTFSCGSKEPCVKWDQDRMNPFAATRGDRKMMVMQPLARLIRTLVSLLCD